MKKRRTQKRRLLSILLTAALLFGNSIFVYAQEPDDQNVTVQQDAEDLTEESESAQEDAPEALNRQDNEKSEATVVNEAEAAAAAEERAASAEELGYVPGEILVTYKEHVSEEDVAQVAEEMDGELIETLAEVEDESVAVVSISDDTTVETAVEEYANDPSIEYAEPNYLVEAFEDEVTTAAESTSQQWYLDYVRAPQAWNILARNNGEKVRVAVIDTGARMDHEDLTNVINKNLSIELVRTGSNGNYTYSAIKLRGDGYLNGTSTQNTSTTHGTHVSGILAAQSGNGTGIQGTASGGTTAKKNNIVDLVAIDAFTTKNEKNEDTGSVGDILYAMAYAEAQGCKVINLSLGTTEKSDILEAACAELKNAGVIVVCAAGNSNTDAPVYPSDYDSTIGVINIDSNGTKSATSNYGSMKDISAPGVSIYSTTSSGTGTYGVMSGTSMATPMVTAAAAMVLYVNPTLSPDQVKEILCGTATDLYETGKDVYSGYGALNVEAALTKAESTKTDVSAASVSAGSSCNATGKAITPEPTVTLGGKTLKKNTDYTLSYSNNINPGTATITITGKGAYKGTKQVSFTIKDATSLTYRVHAQTHGWMSWVGNKATSGTTGQAKRLECLELKLTNQAYTGDIQYRTHVQTYGWLGWSSNGQSSGTTGQAKRMEAVQIKLTGEMANHYDIYYRVHVQTYGWLGWAKNGESAGSAGYAKRMEAIEIQLVPKGSAAPGSTTGAYKHPMVQYQTHVQTYGWQSTVTDGALSGTTGLAKRLEGIKITLPEQDYSGSVQYRTHVQTYGWQDFVSDGALSGTTGKAKRLEAIEIKLTGEMAEHYDIYYRVHAQTYGWLGWAKNGEPAGTAGLAKRLEGIEIRLVAKGGAAPGSTKNAYYDETSL